MITKKDMQLATARIAQRNAETLNPQSIILTNGQSLHEQLSSAQRDLLSPVHFTLPEPPVRSALAEAWETTLSDYRTAWDLWSTVRNANLDDCARLDAYGWQIETPAKSVASAKALLKVQVGKIETAIINAQKLTQELEQLEQAGARAEAEDYARQQQNYFWNLKAHVDSLEHMASRDLKTVADYEAQQATKAMNKLHEEALAEHWERIWQARQSAVNAQLATV